MPDPVPAPAPGPAPPPNPMAAIQSLGQFAPIIAEAQKRAAVFEAEVKKAFQQVLDNQVKIWAKLQAIEAKLNGTPDAAHPRS